MSLHSFFMHLLKESIYHLLKGFSNWTEVLKIIKITLATEKRKKTWKYIFDLDFFPLPIKPYFGEVKIKSGYGRSARLGSLPPISRDQKLSWLSCAIFTQHSLSQRCHYPHWASWAKLSTILGTSGPSVKDSAVKFWVLSPIPILSKQIPYIWEVLAMKPQS